MTTLKFVDAISIESYLEKWIKKSLCEYNVADSVFKSLANCNKELGLVMNHGFDNVTCNIGSFNFDLDKSETLLKARNLLKDNMKRNNECVKKVVMNNAVNQKSICFCLDVKFRKSNMIYNNHN